MNRCSIIKRVYRLDCQHKLIEVVTLQQSFLEASDLGVDRSSLRPLHLCPLLEDCSDDSDAEAPATSRKRSAEVLHGPAEAPSRSVKQKCPTEVLYKRSQYSPEKSRKRSAEVLYGPAEASNKSVKQKCLPEVLYDFSQDSPEKD